MERYGQKEGELLRDCAWAVVCSALAFGTLCLFGLASWTLVVAVLSFTSILCFGFLFLALVAVAVQAARVHYEEDQAHERET